MTMSISKAIHGLQFSLIESSSSSTGQLLAAGSLLSRPDYDDVVVERSIAGLCGYPLCHNPLPLDRDHRGRFRVSLREHRVYNLEETYKYCSEACLVSSRAFFESLSAERVSDLSVAKVEQILRLFGNLKVGGDEMVEEGDFEFKSLKIKEKGDAGAGEVTLDEWIGPANAIEGYVPHRDRIGDSGSNCEPQQRSWKKTESEVASDALFASRLLVDSEAKEICLKGSDIKQMAAKKEEEACTAIKKTKPKKTRSKTSMAKPKNNLEGYGSSNIDFSSSEIAGTEFGDHGGQDISEMIAKQLEKVVLEEKKTRKNAGISRPSRFKHGQKAEGATNEKFFFKEIDGELIDACFGKKSDKTAVNMSYCGALSENEASPSDPTVKKLEDKISSEKKTVIEEKLPKSCLKTSASRVGDHSVKWADDVNNVALEDKRIIPEEHLESSLRIASAEACAAALTQAAESVTSGNAEAGDAVAEAGILILPQSETFHGGRENDEDNLKVDRDVVKWPKKMVLLDTEEFEVDDSWHDTPPEGFSLNLSPFATMWMALFGWINCLSLVYIYGYDESLYENFMLVNGKEYPMKVITSDGQSLEIRNTLDGFICRMLPIVVKEQRLPVPVSTLEKFMGCLLDTLSFMDAIPAFKTKQWHVIILLFIEALSVHRLPVLAAHLKNSSRQLQQVLNAAQITQEEYEIMRDLILPLGRSTDISM